MSDAHPPSAFTGVRILDFTRYQQGPSATVLLSDMGAEVLKVEEPGGEWGRRSGLGADGFSPYFEAHNRGKLSLTLNLKSDGAQEVLRRLVPSCDVVTENFRPGVIERLGLGYEQLRELRDDIILASGSAWGRKGPWAQRGGFDHVAQALSGVMVEQGGGPGAEPHALIGGFADQIGGTMLAFAVASALYVREHTGQGQHLDVSLIGAMTALQAMPLLRYLRTGQQPGFEFRRSATYTHYRCADDRYIAIAANTQPMWERFCEAVERPELATDRRFAEPFGRFDHQAELVAELERLFAERPQSEWLERLTMHDVPSAPVLDYAGVAEHPQFLANGYIQEIEHHNLGRMRVPGPPVQMSATPPRIQGGGPELGQHTEQILLSLGYDWPQIEALREQGTF